MNTPSFELNTRAILRRKSINGILKDHIDKKEIINAIVIWETTFGSHEQIMKDLAEFSRLLKKQINSFPYDEKEFTNKMILGLTKELYSNEADLINEAILENNKSLGQIVKTENTNQSKTSTLINIENTNNKIPDLHRKNAFNTLITFFINDLKKSGSENYLAVFIEQIQISSIPSDVKSKILNSFSGENQYFNDSNKILKEAFHVIYMSALNTVGPTKTDKMLNSAIRQSNSEFSEDEIKCFL